MQLSVILSILSASLVVASMHPLQANVDAAARRGDNFEQRAASGSSSSSGTMSKHKTKHHSSKTTTSAKPTSATTPLAGTGTTPNAGSGGATPAAGSGSGTTPPVNNASKPNDAMTLAAGSALSIGAVAIIAGYGLVAL